jgi:hypothetical protein
MKWYCEICNNPLETDGETWYCGASYHPWNVPFCDDVNAANYGHAPVPWEQVKVKVVKEISSHLLKR